MLEEDLEEELEELLEDEQTGSGARLVAQLEFLLCKGRQMLSDMMKTGGKVLLTALLGVTGQTSSTTVPQPEGYLLFHSFLFLFS